MRYFKNVALNIVHNYSYFLIAFGRDDLKLGILSFWVIATMCQYDEVWRLGNNAINHECSRQRSACHTERYFLSLQSTLVKFYPWTLAGCVALRLSFFLVLYLGSPFFQVAIL